MDVKVVIRDKDRKIGAMVKALAFEIDGPSSVKGSSKEFLESQGYYIFHFRSDEKAGSFKKTLRKYLPEYFAEIIGGFSGG